MQVTILGNCANQTADHEAVNLLVEDENGGIILIDAGPGVVRQILRTGRLCSEIADIVVTHCHGDHTLGFPYVVWNHFYEGMQGHKVPEKIRIYALPVLLKGLQDMLRVCYDISRYPFTLEYLALSDNNRSEFKVGQMNITSVPVDHTVPNIGLIIESAGKKLSYSSDTLYNPNFVEIARGSDLMIHEGFATEELIDLSRRVKHALAMDAGKAAYEAGASRLEMVHLFPPFCGREEELIREASKFFSGPVGVPRELDTIKL